MRIAIAVLAALCAAAADKPLYEAELVFPLEHWHNHSSSLVELPDGDLLVCWYNGSGERAADDVKIEAARRVKGGKEWGPRFTLADTPGFPDTNPILFVDSRKRLWVVWPVILANRWETALLKYRIASAYPPGGAPKWDFSDPLLFIPRNFTEKTHAITGPLLKSLAPGRLADEVKQAHEQAADKYASRMGWMPRVHPLQLPSGRILVPLYSFFVDRHHGRFRRYLDHQRTDRQRRGRAAQSGAPPRRHPGGVYARQRAGAQARAGERIEGRRHHVVGRHRYRHPQPGDQP